MSHLIERHISDDNHQQNSASPAPALVQPSLREAARFWLWLGCVSFGGPGAQIALMHLELVDRRRWIQHAAFQRGLAFCTVLPGPEAQQLATWIGLQLHGVRGGLIAGLSFFLPASVLLWLLSYGYFAYGTAPAAAGVLIGLKCAVVVLLGHALQRMARMHLKRSLDWLLAAGCFLVLATGQSFALYLLAIAVLGALRSPQLAPATRQVSTATHSRARLLALLLTLAFVLLLLVIARSPMPRFMELASLITQAVLITFGGAYAVLPFVLERAQLAGWLDARSAMAGLALAESTPGPLVLVLAFVGFAFGWQLSAGQSPLLSASIGFALALLCTFLPSFVLVFAGAGAIDRISAKPRLNAAVQTMTRAVFGAIAWLAVVFVAALFFPRGLSVRPDWLALALTLTIAVVQWRMRWGSAALVGLGAGLGLLWSLLASAVTA
jgi:chromate transporter